MKTTYMSEMEIQESWSVDSLLGIVIPSLDITTGVNSAWSKLATIKASQAVELTVPPGQMVCNLPP